MKLPFSETQLNENTFIREFDENTNPIEFMWHKDKEDRIIENLEKTDWLIQLDNELPKPINKPIFISNKTYHRLIKGSKNLKIKLTKLNDNIN